jgi:hypothetical protein
VTFKTRTQRIELDGGQSISFAEIEAAADRWVAYQRRHHRLRFARFSRERFVHTAAAWLRFLGRFQKPEEKPTAFTGLVSEFDRYLREERGLSQHTIHNRCWHVQTFLQWFSQQGSGLAELRLE